MVTVLPLTLPSRALTAAIAHVSAIDVDDGTLIERVAAHERVAFEELYRRFARTVLGLALRRIGDRGRSEDTEEEIAVGLPTGADLDEPTGQHIATCPACAAEQASLPQVRSLRGLAR